MLGTILLSIPELAGDDREDFMQCVLATLQRRAYRTGSSGHVKGAIFSSTLYYLVELEGRRLEVDLRFDLKPGNKALHATLNCKDPNVNQVALKQFGDSILNEARSTFVARRKQQFKIRHTYAYFGRPLDGVYSLPGFVLRPADTPAAPAADPNLPRPAVEQLLFLDVDVGAYSREEAWEQAGDKASVLLPRLALILQRTFESPIDAWRIVPANGRFERYRTGFAAVMQPVADVGPEKASSGRFAGDLLFAWAPRGALSLPPEAPAILAGIEGATPDVQQAFDGCARLLEASYALPQRLSSARLSLMVAAIDALARFDDPKGNFKKFATRFIEEIDPQVVHRLYGQLRSGFVHTGNKHLRERMRATAMTDADGHERLDFAWRSYEQLRRGIIKCMEAVFGIKWDATAVIEAHSQPSLPRQTLGRV